MDDDAPSIFAGRSERGGRVISSPAACSGPDTP
jgi:hypothetical protein